MSALHDLGGSATNQELEDKVIEIFQLPEEEAYERREGKSQTRLNYRAAWANSYLKKHGLVDNTERGVWALTAEGQKSTEVDHGQVKATVRDEFAKKKRNADTETHDPDEVCKRYRNTVGSSVVRDFRGAMIGRADKGLIILWSRYRVDPREDFRVRGRLHDLREHVRITDDHWRFSGTRGSPTPAMRATRNVLRGHGLFNQWG